MDEFQKQLQNNRASDIREFLNSSKYTSIRALYRSNFEKIYDLIKKFGYKPSIEDIANIGDESLKRDIFENSLLLQEINKAIRDQELTLTNF